MTNSRELRESTGHAPVLYLALVHYPVLNRRSELIASAITNLDLHDLARLACTYDLPACYIVTPLEDQQALAHRLVGHWTQGAGREILTNRAQALNLLRVRESLGEVREEIAVERGRVPLVLATSARSDGAAVGLAKIRERMRQSGRPAVLLFGTGWGLAPEALAQSDALLVPIVGRKGYNHLSVRCAAAIIVDRFFDEGSVERGTAAARPT